MDETDRQRWNKAAQDYQSTFLLGQNSYNASLLRFWHETGMLHPGDRIIDVGCGVGKYGTWFAELGYDVTLVDISDRMLEHARENMAKYTTPWNTYQCDFNQITGEELAFAGGFDLAISTMSPAIHDTVTARKLNDMTRGWCFLSRFNSWEQPLRDVLMRDIGMEPRKAFDDLEGDCESMLRILREAGFEAQVKTVDYNWADGRTPEQMADYMCRTYFTEEDDLLALREAFITASRTRAGSDGRVNDNVNTTVKWMYWRTVSCK